MPQQQSQRSGEPPIGECSVCGKAVTSDDPGTLQLSASTGTMSNIHDRCRENGEPK